MKESAMAAVVGPVLDQCGLELDRLEIVHAGKRSVVRVFVNGDGPDGHGPSLDDIAAATRAVSSALDESNAAGSAPYTLEVSSRGTNQPLTAERHYRRNIGRLVKLTTADGTLTGRITDVEGDAVRLDVDGEERTVGLPSITKAVVQVELRKERAAEDLEEE